MFFYLFYRININKHMSNRIFAKMFRVVLEQDQQQTGEPADAPEQMTDAQAAQSQLGDGAQVSELGADMNQQAVEMSAKQQQAMNTRLEEWMAQVGEMVEYLNSPNGESIQNVLSKAIPDTLFDKIKKGESKRIARVAEELAGLQQSFAGYRATSNNPSYKYV
jgi:hypothetical protein